MDTTVIRTLDILVADGSLEGLCRHWCRVLRRIEAEIPFMNAAGCVDIMRSTFGKRKFCAAVLEA